MKKYGLVITVVVLALAPMAMGQALTANATTPIAAVKAETLTISVVAPLADFAIDAGGTQSTSSQTLSISTTRNLKPSRSTLDVCAAATAALAASDPSNTDSIPVTAVEGNPGSGWAALNAGANCGQAAVTLVKSHTLNVAGEGWKNVTKVDTVDLRLNGLDANLQADRYVGTITVYAYAL